MIRGYRQALRDYLLRDLGALKLSRIERSHVQRIVDELLSVGPTAARTAKALARAPQSAEQTARSIAEHRTSDEGQEGLRAFLEKRTAIWRAEKPTK